MSERIVHLGLGAFFRAHQAYYSFLADPEKEWGIVAYTGRQKEQAELLSAQGCKYTLVTRSAEGDSFELIDSVVRAEPGTNLEDLKITVSNPEIAIITMTITEAGYQVQPGALEDSALGRLALALEARRQAGAGALALVPCDNLPANGEVLREAMIEIGQQLGPEFLEYLNDLSFVTTSIDRITPKTKPEDIGLVQQITGFDDHAPVITEPFKDWVLEGEFPKGRPAWESAGAKFVSDIEPFENRKLWLLNGAHSLLAYYGQFLGHKTVDQAISDLLALSAVNEFWDEAARHLDEELLSVSSYREALLERFRNPRIGYQLSQIAQDGLNKLSVRIAPVAIAELKAGRMPIGSLRAIACWAWYLESGAEIKDSRLDEISKTLGQGGALATVGKLLPVELFEDPRALNQVAELLAKFQEK